MPTSFEFNSTQLAEIKRLHDSLEKPENKPLAGGGAALYSYVFKAVTGIDLSNDSLTMGQVQSAHNWVPIDGKTNAGRKTVCVCVA